jgi:curved DNA-binding protein CbpA
MLPRQPKKRYDNQGKLFCRAGLPHMAAVQGDSAVQQTTTYYDVLGLPHPPVALTLQEIKTAYHRALLKSHPDKVSGTDGFQVSLVREAWAVLGDDTLRKEYDRRIEGIIFVQYGTNSRWACEECFCFRRFG